MKKLFIYNFIFIVVIKSSLQKTLTDIPESCPTYLTISPITKTVDDSKLEINWGPSCANPPEWIGLFVKDPSISDDRPEFAIKTNSESFGYIKTNISIGKLHLPNGWDHDDVMKAEVPKRSGPKCLPFYIASFIKNEISTLDCLKIQPNWMSNIDIGKAQLKDLMIPGTHCSGCYVNRSGPKSVVIKRFGIAQNFDVWTQLVMGIRYLDIDIGYDPEYNGTKRFWIMGNGIRISKFEIMLNDIRKFVILSGEIVILGIDEFPMGMYKHPERHQELIQFLENELGDIAYRSNRGNYKKSPELTIDEMRKKGKTLLILYNNEEIAEESDLVWTTWTKHTSEYLKLDEYREYIRNLFARTNQTSKEGRVYFGIQGVESTYEPSKYLLTVRERAESINRHITRLIGGPWSFNVNVIALDFFMSSNIIDIAVYTNSYKNYDIKEKNESQFDLLVK